jgi:thiol-disulfide isomerase/thioredoxin
MMPVLDDLQEMYGSHIEIEKVNVADNKDKVEQFGVMGVPSIFLYIDDELVHFGKGFQSLDMLNDKIEEELEAHE